MSKPDSTDANGRYTPIGGRVQYEFSHMLATVRGAGTTTRVPGSAGGFYVYVPPKGPTPSGWRWVEQKQGTKP